MGIFEAVTRIRLMPYPAGEEVFRPTGLTDHPLSFGLVCAATIGFVALTRWPVWLRVGAILLLFFATALSGARFSLLLACAEIVLMVVLLPWGLPARSERKAKFGVLLLTLLGGVALIVVLAAGGFLARFEGGLVDENFFARTDIYKIFGLVSLNDILFGADLNAILKIVNDKLGLPYIESTPVYLTFQLGAILALVFAGIVFWLFWRLLRHQPRAAWIGTGVFLAAALSNNTLSTKTPVVAIFVVLLVAYMEAVPTVRPPASASPARSSGPA
jgi:ABC-type multidrug transport system fused ATPase/permease subunit